MEATVRDYIVAYINNRGRCNINEIRSHLMINYAIDISAAKLQVILAELYENNKINTVSSVRPPYTLYYIGREQA